MKKKLSLFVLTLLVGMSVWAQEQQDGVYQISSAQDLVDFAAMVNNGETDANAVLTADIDMSGVEGFTGIGVARNTLYVGTFDGQGHKISGLTISLPEKEEVGMFHIAGDAVLKNFWLDETCSITGSKNVGLVGWCNAASGCTFEKVGTAAKMVGGENTAALIGRGWSSTAPMSFTDCWTIGEIDNTSATTGNWIGWCSNWKAEFTNCWTTSKFAIAPADGNYLTRKGDNVKFKNCYTIAGSQGIRMTEEDVASGALCYMLNSDQTTITWYQNLGEGGDPYPVLDSSHGQVYKTGKIRCDGVDTGETIYTNTDTGSEVVKPDHNYVNGICTVCNSYDPELIVDGVYQISLPEQLVWFSDYVNSGHNGVNARLTADIDMSGVENFTPIGIYHDNIEEVGSCNMQYTGTFDGGRHVIRNLTVFTEQYYEAGLFSRIYQATVSDLGIENASITTNNPKGRAGAFAGLNREGTFFNCWSAGTISLSTIEVDPSFGGIAGNTNNTAGKYINCWSTYEGPLTTESGSFSNCYSYADNPNILTDARSGALCYALNGESFIDVTWYQTIGEDEYPTWDATKGIVYKTTEGFSDVLPDIESSLAIFISNMIESESQFVDEAIACQALLDEYQKEVDTWETIGTFADFCASYVALQEQKEAIQASAAAYEAYFEACEYAIQYLKENDFKSDIRTLLETYLNEYGEPGEEYANGTYEYIRETHLLNDAEIAAETDYVNELLQKAIATNIIPGTEITITLAGYDFRDGLNGWSVESSNGGMKTGGEPGLMNVVEGSNTVFSVSQVMTEVPNGIYVFSANGFSRAGDDITSTLYSGQLYLNGNYNFLMTEGEDAISKEGAKDGVNCHLTGDGPDAEFIYGETEGYVPASLVGCSYAFNAGRYLNYTAVEVTDETLEIGVRNPGSGLAKDWTVFGNVHVWYLGSAEQANEKLESVLAGYVARAQGILDFPWASDLEYYKYPNMSETLKTELAALIDESKTAGSGEAKMAVINKLTAIFTEVYDCRKAYVALATAAEGLLDQIDLLLNNGFIDEATYNQIIQIGLDAWDTYQRGTVSTEEALELAKSLAEALNGYGGIERDANGVYHLKNADNVMAFALFVNNGETSANAVMDADIDMTEAGNFSGIGVPRDVLYAGTFDGQGHKFSGLTISYPEKEDVGLFHIAKATLKNFWLDETCLIEGDKGVALVGWCNGDSPEFEKIGVAAQIKGSENTSSFIGRAWKNPQFKNCWSVGEIDNNVGNGNKKNTGVFMGWCNTWGGSFTNCWTTATFTVAPADGNYLTRKGDNVIFNNTYTLRGSQAKKMTEDDVTSGALCYMLNGDQSEIVWYQTLGVDPHPVLDSSHGIVIKNEDGSYGNETHIDIVHSQQPTIQSGTYDMMGRKVADGIPSEADLPKGLYIINRKKVMIK